MLVLRGCWQKTPNACRPPGRCGNAGARSSVHTKAGVQAGWDIQIEPDLSDAPGSPRAAPGTPDHAVRQAQEVWLSYVACQAGCAVRSARRSPRKVVRAAGARLPPTNGGRWILPAMLSQMGVNSERPTSKTTKPGCPRTRISGHSGRR